MESLRKPTTTLNPNLFILLGLSIIFSVVVTTNFYKFTSPKIPVYLTLHQNEPQYPTSLEISGVINNLGVTRGSYTQGTWDLSDNQAVYLNSSGLIGKTGNLVIYGHDTQKVLGNLNKAKVGEGITLKTNTGEVFHYQITQIRTVSPNDLSILEQGSEETITLYTCSGFLDTTRLVIIGRRI